MADLDARLAMPKWSRPVGILAVMTSTLMFGACAQVGGDDSSGLLAALSPEAQPPAAQSAAPLDAQSAVEHSGQEYSKDPRNIDKALAYAKSLKAIGQKGQALAVLQQASLISGSDKRVASEYGRLALEMDQVSVAKKLLEVADDPGNPDWRVVLARGTVLAKEGRYREAIGFYERAQALQPGHPSVVNNLALAYAMSGDASKGEELLRQASTSSEANPKVRQNLALVLGLQGKYDESTKVGSVDLSPDKAQQDTDLLKKMVKLDAKSSGPAALPSNAWDTQVAEIPAPAQRRMKPAAVDSEERDDEPKPAKVAAGAEPLFKPSAR
jgi:Flp pilus assembly protein TadD